MTRTRGPIRLALCFGALLCLLAPAAAAQIDTDRLEPPIRVAPDESDPDDLRLTVRWGFNGSTVIAEAWTPVRFWVTSGATPRSGAIQISYQQDGSQAARISLPYATTPGVVVPIDATLAIPASCNTITVRLTDERGRAKKTYRFDRYTDNPEYELPTIISTPGAAILAVGDTSLARVATKLVAAVNREPDDASGSDDPWAHALITTARPVDLSASWMAYDAYAAVVISAPDFAALPLDAREALKRWLRSGGTIILVSGAPGDAWRLFLPADDLFRLAPIRTIDTPEELADLTDTTVTLDTAREISLSDRARSRGWTTRWDTADNAALLAEGPVGFGHAVILGVDPIHAVQIVNNDNMAPIWRDILRPILDRRADLAYAEYTYFYGWDVSGASVRHKSAITAVIDGFLRVPSPGSGVFVLLTAFIVLLAILVGPFDAIMLKKLRKRQLSWATALAYTALASILAAGVPLTLRSKNTSYTRASIIDSISPELGGVSERTAITSIYTGTPQAVTFDGVPAGSWWRPVSARTLWGEATMGTTFSTVQTAAATASGFTRQTLPDAGDNANPQRLWTLRTLMDQGPATPILARVEHTDTPDGYVATIRGLDGAINFEHVNVHFMNDDGSPSWVHRVDHSFSDGVLRVEWSSGGSLIAIPTAWEHPDADKLSNNPWRVSRRARVRQATPSDLADLPGAWERTGAIERYVSAGCVLIAFQCDRAEPDVTLRTQANTRAVEVHRVVLPLPSQEPAP